MTEIDHAIESYRAELAAEAELARDDLAELEDHLRTLIDDLRATGLSSEQAITAARQRLGDPALLAREHARVRTPFGARLSRARAFSAGTLFLVYVIASWLAHSPRLDIWVHMVGIGVVLGVALFARLSWARAAVAGVVGYNLFDLGLYLVTYDGAWLAPQDWMFAALQLGVLAFVMPWRRGEIGPAGYALGLISVMHLASLTSMWSVAQLSPELGTAVGNAAYLVTLLAGVGIVMRARWAAALAALGGGLLVVATVVVTRAPHPGSWLIAESIVVGACAAFACCAISWRTARSSLGTLRGFVTN